MPEEPRDEVGIVRFKIARRWSESIFGEVTDRFVRALNSSVRFRCSETRAFTLARRWLRSVERAQPNHDRSQPNRARLLR